MIWAVAVRCGEADLRHSLLPGVSGQRRASDASAVQCSVVAQEHEALRAQIPGVGIEVGQRNPEIHANPP